MLHRNDDYGMLRETEVSDMKTKQFGFWEVLSIRKSPRGPIATVRCVCGAIKERQLHTLKSGKSKSCGCRQKPRKEVTSGDTFGDLTVVEDLSSRGDKHRKMRVRCTCGAEAVVILENLTSYILLHF